MHSYRFIIERDDGEQRKVYQTQYVPKIHASLPLPDGLKEELEEIILKSIAQRIREEIEQWEKG